MHHRSVSATATEGNSERVLLQKRGSVPVGSLGYGVAPSRFRTEAEAPYANKGVYAGSRGRVSLSRSGNSLSEDQIVCQSRLYDAFELQELEQHLDRQLNFLTGPPTGSTSTSISDQQSLNPHKCLLSAYSLPNHRPPIADHLRGSQTCNFCKNPSFSGLTNDSPRPTASKPSLTTVSGILIEPPQLHEESTSYRCSQPRGDDENHASFARRSFSMPRQGHLDVDQETLQGLQVHADQYAISSAASVLQAHNRGRARRSRWACVNSLFRSLRAIYKKQVNVLLLGDCSTPMNCSRQQRPMEYYHHHNIVHCHHVHHHHHHHVVNGVPLEEIDWPLSPGHLQELG